jgi:hypothetical protein
MVQTTTGNGILVINTINGGTTNRALSHWLGRC